MGANADPLGQREPHRAAHDERVAGMEAARQVGAADDLQQRRIVAHLPGAEAFAKVGVEVDQSRRHVGVLRIRIRRAAAAHEVAAVERLEVDEAGRHEGFARGQPAFPVGQLGLQRESRLGQADGLECLRHIALQSAPRVPHTAPALPRPSLGR